MELVAYAISGGIESVSHSSKGEITMSALKKLLIKTVSRQTVLSLAEIRRKKMVSKIEEQQALLESVQKGQEFKVTRQRVTRDTSGAKVRLWSEGASHCGSSGKGLVVRAGRWCWRCGVRAGRSTALR